MELHINPYLATLGPIYCMKHNEAFSVACMQKLQETSS